MHYNSHVSFWHFHRWDLLIQQIPVPTTQKEKLPDLGTYPQRDREVLWFEGRIEHARDVLKTVCHLLPLNVPFNTRNISWGEGKEQSHRQQCSKSYLSLLPTSIKVSHPLSEMNSRKTTPNKIKQQYKPIFNLSLWGTAAIESKNDSLSCFFQGQASPSGQGNLLP